MALLYPWASKDYLLWHMSLDQIMLYHNIGVELKYGKQDNKPRRAKDMSYEELKRIRDDMRQKYGDIGGEK